MAGSRDVSLEIGTRRARRKVAPERYGGEGSGGKIWLILALKNNVSLCVS